MHDPETNPSTDTSPEPLSDSSLPNLIVIGAAKCGTTSLHYYLNLHPDIQMAREKELHFFSKEERWTRGLEWYRRHFDPGSPVRGEASVTYTAFPFRPGVPARMAQVVPDARLVYLVRDPVERIVSAYVHRHSEREENRSLAAAVEQLEDNDLVERSRYFFQLEQYRPHFPDAQILVISSEELRRDRRAVLSKIFGFVGVDPAFATERMGAVKHESRHKRRKSPFGVFLGRLAESAPARVVSPDTRRAIGRWVYKPFSAPLHRPVMDDRARTRLVNYLAPDVAKLREYTGLPFSEWTV